MEAGGGGGRNQAMRIVEVYLITRCFVMFIVEVFFRFLCSDFSFRFHFSHYFSASELNFSSDFFS